MQKKTYVFWFFSQHPEQARFSHKLIVSPTNPRLTICKFRVEYIPTVVVAFVILLYNWIQTFIINIYFGFDFSVGLRAICVIPFSAWIVGVILGVLNVKLWPAFSVKIHFFVCKEDKYFDSDECKDSFHCRSCSNYFCSSCDEGTISKK